MAKVQESKEEPSQEEEEKKKKMETVPKTEQMEEHEKEDETESKSETKVELKSDSSTDKMESKAEEPTCVEETESKTKSDEEEELPMELTASELILSSELTSLNFGFIHPNKKKDGPLTRVASKIVAYLERCLLNDCVSKKRKADILLKLGHVHLLLNDFEKALSAYQKYHRLSESKEKNSKKKPIDTRKVRLECRTRDASFLYGLALVYQHFDQTQWATELFLQLLYLHPLFPLSREVHVQLGSALSEKTRDLGNGLRHLNTALTIKQSRQLQDDEDIQFAIAHLNQVCNERGLAVKQYSKLLQSLEPFLEQQPKTSTSEPSTDCGKKDVRDSVAHKRRLVAETHRQLGWLYFSGVRVNDSDKSTSNIDDADAETRRLQSAVKHLQRSIELQSELGITSSIGQSLYLLGRCYASMNKVHEAFVAYRNSVDKSESNADTWCSIGILYQQQNQPMDALQAYICAVQLDKNHFSAWLNLAILYESALQFHDALVAYNNAMDCDHTEGKDSKTVSWLAQRVQLIRNKLSGLSHGDSNNYRETASKLTGRKALPSVEEAWDLPILNEMSGNRQQQQQHQQHNGTVKVVTATRVHSAPDSSRRLMMISRPAGAPAIMAMRPAVTVPNAMMMVSNIHNNGLTVQQMQNMHYLQNLNIPLTPQQQVLLHQLQTLHKQHQMKMMHQQQQLHHPQQQQQQQKQHLQQDPHPEHQQQKQQEQKQQQSSSSVAASSQSNANGTANSDILHDKDFTNVSDTELEALISQQDIGSFAESLLKQIQENDENTVDDRDGDNNSSDGNAEIKKEEPMDTTSVDTTLDNVSTSLEGTSTSTNDKNSRSHEKPVSLQSLNIPSDLNEIELEEGDWPRCDSTLTMPRPAESMDTFSIVEFAKSLKFVPRALFLPIAMQATSCIPQTPPKPNSSSSSAKEQLLPPTPTVLMDSKKNVASPQLQDFCLKHPVTVVRGIAGALKLDCGLFATKHLAEMHNKHTISVLSHPKPMSESEVAAGPTANESYNYLSTGQEWKYERVSHTSTIGEFSNYQSNTFNESLKLEQERISTNRSSSTDVDMDGDSASTSATASGMRNKRKKSTGIKGGPGTSQTSSSSEDEPLVYFAPNIELNDQREFRAQLAELMKLPPWLRTVSARNLLSHLGYNVCKVRLEMKVPGARNVAVQDCGQGCVVNINVGPGDCEWFAVPPDYWQTMLELCRANNVNFNKGEWWPSMRDLMQNHVPVYRFLQRPGDLVWVNAGSTFWVQAVGWFNCVQWTVAPLSHPQFELMLHKYEWNRLHCVKNAVPIIHLAWQLSQNVRIEEQVFYNELRAIMAKSLAQFAATQRRVKALQEAHLTEINKKNNEGEDKNESDNKEEKDNKNVTNGEPSAEKQQQLLKVVVQIRKRADPVYFCTQCEDELFGSVFMEALETDSVQPLCYFCSRKRSSKLEGFVCLEEFRLADLTQALNGFRLHEKNILSNLISSGANSPNQKPALINLNAVAQGVQQAGQHSTQLANALHSYLTNSS